jgi:acetyltransferase-like isoleucine patch superfamily enzyme
MLKELNETIKYNTIVNSSKPILIIRYFINALRTFYILKIRYPWVKKKGFLRIPFNIKMWSPNKSIILGNKVQFGQNCRIQCDLEIGDEVLIAGNVSFIGRNDHNYNVIGSSIWNSPRGENLKTIIGNDCWIGHGVIILAGVKIGNGSVIAAGSVVTNNIDAYSIYGGVPAKKLKHRFTEDELNMHLKSNKFNGR